MNGVRLVLVAALSFGVIACDDAEDDNNAADMSTGAGGEGGGGGDLPAEYRDLTNPLAGDADAAAAGQGTYDGTCATCHGADGTGGPQFMPAATDFTTGQNAVDGYYFYRIREGAEGGPDGSIMPAYADFSDDEVWQLITYIRSFAN